MNHDQRFKLFFRRFFREFLVLFYPRLAAQIDWSEPFEFLDKEMQKLAGDKTGRTVDILIKVKIRSRSGRNRERLCLFHIEVESRKSRPQLGQRIFEYFCILY